MTVLRTLLLLLLVALPAAAQTRVEIVRWDNGPCPVATCGTPTGYKVHHGTASGAYTTVLDVGMAAIVSGHYQASIPVPAAGERFIAVSAYGAQGQSSVLSNEKCRAAAGQVCAVPPPPPPPQTVTSSIADGASVAAGTVWSVTVTPSAEWVEFWADGQKLLEDTTAPYSVPLLLPVGTHRLGICVTSGGQRACLGTGGVYANVTVTAGTPPPPPPPPPPVFSAPVKPLMLGPEVTVPVSPLQPGPTVWCQGRYARAWVSPVAGATAYEWFLDGVALGTPVNSTTASVRCNWTGARRIAVKAHGASGASPFSPATSPIYCGGEGVDANDDGQLSSSDLARFKQLFNLGCSPGLR